MKKLLVFLVLSAILSACAERENSKDSTESCAASVTGMISFTGWTELPEDALVYVQLIDTTETSVGARNDVGNQFIDYPAQMPTDYEICYDPSEIQESVTYSMYVTIEGSGMPYGINDDLNPVITGGNPNENVDIVVTPLDL